MIGYLRQWEMVLLNGRTSGRIMTNEEKDWWARRCFVGGIYLERDEKS